jgi:hypothetical protein
MCATCGHELQLSWESCPACSNPANSNRIQNDHDRLLHIGIGATFLSLVLAPVSMILPWGSETSNTSLFSSPGLLAYNVPALVVIFFASLLTLKASVRSAAAVLLGLFSIDTAIGLSNSIISVLLSKDTAGPGLWVSLASFLSSLTGTVLLARRTGLRLKIGTQSLFWAVAGLTSASLWVLGDWFPWVQTTYHANSGFKFTGSGTNTLVIKCCTPFQNSTWPTTLRSVLSMLFILAAVLGINFLIPEWVSGVAMSSLGLLYLSDNLHWLASTIAAPILDPNKVPGWTVAKIASDGLSETQMGLFGGWISLGACIILIFIGVFRTIGAIGKRDKSFNAN